MYSGECQCGGVRFQIRGELEPVQVCHCGQCRRAQGTPFATNIPVSLQAFSLLQGAELVAAFESSPGKQRCFCRRCGSPLYSRREDLPEVLRIRAGLINEPLKNGPLAHSYVDSRCNWWPIDDQLPRFPAGYTAPSG